MFMLRRQALALALRHPLYSVLACAVAITTLAWQGQGAWAQNAQQDQPASFTLSQAKGKCAPVTGYGAHFPPGSTVIIEGPTVNGRVVSGPSDYVEIEKQVAADGTFTVTFKPCPRQVVTGAGTFFPVSDSSQFMFTADTRAQNGVGAEAIYTVSGLGNAGLPSTGAPASGVGIPGVLDIQPIPIQPPLFAIMLFVGGALAVIGGCLLLIERAQHQES